MLVRTLDELDAIRRIRFPADASFRSARFFTADDSLGFSYHENRVQKGTDLRIWLKHHWEANYIVSGKGELTDLTNQVEWQLEPGVLYTVGPNDRHCLHLAEDECHISIFCPPLRGDERFDEDGSYEASGPIEETDRRMFVRRVDDAHVAGKQIITDGGRARETPMLTPADAVGFALSDARVKAGAEVIVSEKHSCQANHILSGSGETVDLRSGQSRPLVPSTSVAAGPDDQLHLRAKSDMHLLRVFASALLMDD